MQLDLFRRAREHQLAAGLTAFRPEVDDPIRRTDHVQVVLDRDHRVPGVEQLAQRAHQLGDVVEVQPRRRFVEQIQRAFAGHALPGPLCRLREKACQLQPLRLAAGQCRHRLAQAHVVEADVDDRLQLADHFAVVGEQMHRFADGEVERVGDRKLAIAADDLHVEDLGAENGGRRNRGSGGTRRRGTASRHARSPSRRRSGSGRRRR